MNLKALLAAVVLAAPAAFVMAQPGTGTQPPKESDKKQAPSTKTQPEKEAVKEGIKRPAPAKGGAPAVGDTAPDWTLNDAEGSPHKLSDYKGKVVVLDFWATWCGPCVKAMPSVQRLHEKYKDKGVKVFGVNTWEKGDAPKFMKDKGFTYGLLMKGDDVAKAYGVNGIPTFYVIGHDGKVVFHEVGKPEDAKITKAIDDAVAAAEKTKK
ncbi:MAG: TlpA family protein disulfide reductase [Phycisphaerales bacterium]|nr:TlpA family protein disulfide reductase [Phycisphaerales bacterium]